MLGFRFHLHFQTTILVLALHHQRFHLTVQDYADLGKTCPSNKWFRLLGLSCNVVQNNPSFLVSFSLLFDLIKNSCYLLSIMWLRRSPFIIYILNQFLLTVYPLPLYRQTAYHCCLPEKSTRENKLLLENYNELLW